MTAADTPDATWADDGRGVDAVGRLRAAAEILRVSGTRAEGLDWDAIEDLHRIGVASSDIALPLADLLDWLARAGENGVIIGASPASRLTDAIIGNTP